EDSLGGVQRRQRHGLFHPGVGRNVAHVDYGVLVARIVLEQHREVNARRTAVHPKLHGRVAGGIEPDAGATTTVEAQCSPGAVGGGDVGFAVGASVAVAIAVGVAVATGVGVRVGLGVAVGVGGTVGVGVGEPPSRASLMACSSGFRCPAG